MVAHGALTLIAAPRWLESGLRPCGLAAALVTLMITLAVRGGK
jgi:hypothetical protein